jgi:hypothetical protein
MPSSPDHDPISRQRSSSWKGFWPSIARIALLEVTLLLALAGGAVVYVKWSSQAAFAEFLAASKVPSPGSSPYAVKGQAPCERGV